MARAKAREASGLVEGPWALPEGWRWERLGRYVSSGGTSVTPARSPDAVFQLYSVPSYPTGRPELVNGRSVGSSKQSVIVDDILLCKINPRINRVWKVRDFGQGKLIASTEWIRFAADAEIEPGYLRYFLTRSEVRDYLAMNVSGVGGSLMRVRPATVEPIFVPVPPREVQARIVAHIDGLFAEVDDGEAALVRARSDLETWRKSLLKAAVTGELTADWRAANPPAETGADLLARILKDRHTRWLADPRNKGKRYAEPVGPQASSPPDVPGGWAWGSLPQLGDFGRGKSKHRPRNDPRLYGGSYPFVQTGVVTSSRGRIRKFAQTYTELGLAQSKLWPCGTLCITIAANIAKTGVLQFDACFPDSVVGLTCVDEVHPEYVELFIRTLQSTLEDDAPATAQKNINLETLEELGISIPSSAEQSVIVKTFEEAEAAGDLLLDEEINQASAALRQSILAAAFRGDLVA